MTKVTFARRMALKTQFTSREGQKEKESVTSTTDERGEMREENDFSSFAPSRLLTCPLLGLLQPPTHTRVEILRRCWIQGL